MAGLLVGAKADLSHEIRISSLISPSKGHHRLREFLGRNVQRVEIGARTEGIVMLPLKRLRTRLSIPLGLRQLGARHLNRSLWWRLKLLVPIIQSVNISSSCFHRQTRSYGRSIYPSSRVSPQFGKGYKSNIRFLTIGTCFFAATILKKNVSYGWFFAMINVVVARNVIIYLD